MIIPASPGSAKWLRYSRFRASRVAVEHCSNPQAGHMFPLRGKNGQEWIRTTEGVSQRIYSPPRLATSVPTRRSSNRTQRLADSAKRGCIVIDFITIFANGKSLLSVG